ncbi:chemoreceptor glutamine deamidase CheD [Methylomonas sp. SURF-1]|uniref:Probable chemoreceptor glutamine deamidase CheD n=1 Tax=Methylomonas aurea TaxID=2952224 RepID=A0ABT1ULP2_9GAMM|nr:chemoreceptor glutamine deamidase CheD [Methylomonas sp. SURF-1]MCQ8183027.1 chemoreceptor glutamine deamidase CheD [Methylomonas sp. SURF-1]
MYLKQRSATYFDPYWRTRAQKIIPGEYCVATSGSVIVTVVGSCVTACIRDRDKGIGGMSHFMVANTNEGQPINARLENQAKAAMDKFINHLLDIGAEPHQLEAKLFGGGNVLNGLQRDNVGARSAQFLRNYLAERNIPVIAADMLDIYPRKVYFFPESGKVLVKKLKDIKNETILKREQEYSQRIFAGSLA